MKHYTEQDLDALFERYNDALRFEGEARCLEAARAGAERGGTAHPRRRGGRALLLVAVCAAVATASVFAGELVDYVKEAYRFKSGSMNVVVSDTIVSRGERFAVLETPYIASGTGSSCLKYNHLDYDGIFRDGIITDQGSEAYSSTLITQSLEEAQAVVPYPLLTVDAAGLDISEIQVFEHAPGVYREGAFIAYGDAQYNDGNLWATLSQDYVGPDYASTIYTVWDYQPVTILGVEGIFQRTDSPERDVYQTHFEFICNRLSINLSIPLPPEEATPFAEGVLAQALAIDWDAVEAEIAATFTGPNGQSYLLYNPIDYADIGMRRYHKLKTLAEVQGIVPYPLVELTLPDISLMRGEVTEYRPDCYFEGACLIYEYRQDGQDMRYYVRQQYRGPDYTGPIATEDMEAVTVAGVPGFWAPGTPEAHSTDPDRTELRFLVNRLELRIDLPAGYEDALTIAEQLVTDALAIDWDAVEADLAWEFPDTVTFYAQSNGQQTLDGSAIQPPDPGFDPVTHEIRDLDIVKALVPYPLLLPDSLLDITRFDYAYMIEFAPDSYQESAYLYFREKDGMNLFCLSQDYVGPDYRLNIQTKDEYEAITLGGVEGIYYCHEETSPYPGSQKTVTTTDFRFICNSMSLSLSFPLPFEESCALAEDILSQAQAIDWDAVRADLAQQ